jgi:TonB family protein
LGQCDLELQEKIEKKMKEDKVSFLKKFSADLGPGEDVASYSFALEKKTWYRFYIYESDKTDGKGYFEIADDKRILATTMEPYNQKTYNSLDFKCNKTRVYNISIKKDGGEDYCAEVALARVKEIKDEKDLAEIKKNLDPEYRVFTLVEEMPQFIEGDNTFEPVKKWISNNLIYPEEAKKIGIRGRVFVSFVVSRKGEVEDVQIVRGVDPILDNYVLELIQEMPKWAHPGYQDGVEVNVKYTCPVVFGM